MTSGTVFVAVLALVLFGGPVLYSFSVAMLWGVIVGTYSSIWVACAGLVYLKLRPEQLRPDDEEGREGQGVKPPARSGPLGQDPADAGPGAGPAHPQLRPRPFPDQRPRMALAGAGDADRDDGLERGARRGPRARQARGAQGGADADRASGAGLRRRAPIFVPPALRAALKAAGLALEVVDTGSACRIYNVLLAEGRRVAAALSDLASADRGRAQ